MRIPHDPAPSIYSANITKGSLKLRESRMVAALLLGGVKGKECREEIEKKNILQARSASTATSLAGSFARALHDSTNRFGCSSGMATEFSPRRRCWHVRCEHGAP